MVGTCGEHLTCFDLYHNGFPAHIIGGQHQYEIIMYTNQELLKIQVKTTNYTERGSYRYVIKRHKTDKVIGDYDCIDMFAFACPKLRKVAYIPINEITQKYKVSIQPSMFDFYTIDRAWSVHYDKGGV